MLPLEIAKYRYSLHSPFAPPDRRYQLARAYMAHGVRPSSRSDDAHVWEVYKFLRARATYRQPAERVTEVLRKYRDLDAAFQIHHGKVQSLRPVLEAYLLSRAHHNDIVLTLLVTPATVTTYEKIFYDIECYLEYPMYVFDRLIGLRGKHGLKKLTEVATWKLLGYIGGPKALNNLFGNLQGVAQPLGEDGLKGWLSQRTQAILQIKQLQAASRLEPSNEKHMDYLLRLIAQGQRTQDKEADPPLSTFEMHTKAMLEAFDFSVGPGDVPEPLKPWADSAAELRDHEERQLMAGVELPELEELKNFEFPLGRSNANPVQDTAGPIVPLQPETPTQPGQPPKK
jgi:hypothetical protein